MAVSDMAAEASTLAALTSLEHEAVVFVAAEAAASDPGLPRA
jgi:hypothetical protein